ncbi:carbohydrate binding domain-containing protein [Butyrivibrio sp. AE2032]|uniref:carbohydrate binding domain-containing protein n=1 Tax=Butyrivibrio sp. AE2032 TaxID=1458463 RepID=UPI000689D9DC|nr:carbohydrate binding domain-containing protein [Butyrivibrio sp. AE2032]
MRKFWLKKSAVTAMSVATAVAMLPTNVLAKNGESASEAQTGDGYELVWSDEFDGDSLNTGDWNVETHEPGWVNAELQRYTSLDEGNIEVSDGTLKIKPHKSEAEATQEENSEENQGQSQEAEVTDIAFDFTVGENESASDTVALQINFGKIDDSAEGTAPANVSVFDVSLKDEDGNELLKDTAFEDVSANWSMGFNEDGKGSADFSNGKANIIIESAGGANYHVQLQQGGLSIQPGNTYHFSMKATSSVDRKTELSILDPNNGWHWYGGSVQTIKGSAVSGGSGASASSGKAGEITSGRITTQNKHDFTYGRFEARAKVPAGQGYLPAFWLMATDEGNYGQWPKCGEIDIMEVMGQDTSKSYHTIHYGYSSGSGHKENQGTRTIEANGYSNDFHDYVVEWDPGKITWFVDGEEVYTTSDWYTGTDDDNQITYPAPFDQNFYVILNLAVGGSWVGYPDDETYSHINEDAYEIDYVRVYQKSAEEYERLENECVKPEKEPVSFREADESGNYVKNSQFKDVIAMDGSAEADKDNWKLHLESDASGTTYALSNEGITITPDSTGKVDYSIQLKQENVPMYKGWEYELSFDAYATEERNIIVDVEGPDRGWDRYLKDTTVAIGTTKEAHTIPFTMEKQTDANGSLEFNLGNQGSNATVTISNVRLVHKSGEEIKDDGLKVIRPDGNYIYNGSFDQGEKRLGYWEIDEADKANVSVTNVSGTRELKVVVPEGKTVKVRQSELSPIGKGTYDISFSARCAEESAANGLAVVVAGTEFAPQLGGENAKYSKKINFETDNTREGSYVEILFKEPGTYYLDNIFLTEAALLKNGSFNAGLASFSPYIYDTVKASYVIDNMNGNDNTFAITIEDTMADDAGNDWYVQLNQDGITLEEGKSYKLSFKAKSNIDRAIKYSCQQFEGNWTNYSGTGSVQVGPEWKTFTAEFKMTNPTDTNTRFNITMGSVDGKRITEKHDVYIDDISLIELDYEVTENKQTETTGDDNGQTVEPGTGEGGNDEPANPDQPSNPDEPTNPDEPGSGEGGNGEGGNVEPTNPDQPVDPDQPSEPEQPAEEDKPSVPSTPLQPAQPAPVVVAVKKVVTAVVKTVAKVVTSIVKSIFRLFR